MGPLQTSFAAVANIDAASIKFFAGTLSFGKCASEMNSPGPKKTPGIPFSINNLRAPGDSIPGRNSFSLPLTAGTTLFINCTTGSSSKISVTSLAPLGIISNEASISESSDFNSLIISSSCFLTSDDVCQGIILTSKVALALPPTTLTAEPPLIVEKVRVHGPKKGSGSGAILSA